MATKHDFSDIASWLDECTGVKAAGVAGQGKSTHSTATKSDPYSCHASPGSRSRENTDDVKKTLGASSVTGDEPVRGSRDDNQPNIGMRQSTTGEDPSVEKGYKQTLADPGTSFSPTSTSAVTPKSAGLAKMAQDLADLGNSLLADICVGNGDEKQASQQRSQATQAGAAQTGYEAAEYAAIKQAHAVVANAMAEGEAAAELVRTFYSGYNAEHESLTKWAADMAAMAEGAGEPQVDPAMLAAAQGGGAPEGAGDPAAEGDTGAGGDPEADEQAQLDQLTSILMEMGIDPQQLLAEAQGPGGEAPPQGSPGEKMSKIASVVHGHMRSGDFTFTPAKSAADKARRKAMKQYINELRGAVRG